MRRWLIGCSLAFLLVTQAGAHADERRRGDERGAFPSHRNTGKARGSGRLTVISVGGGTCLTTSPSTSLASVKCAVSGRGARIAAKNIAVNLNDYGKQKIERGTADVNRSLTIKSEPSSLQQNSWSGLHGYRPALLLVRNGFAQKVGFSANLL